MTLQDRTPPPYPPESARTETIHVCLYQLAEWLDLCRDPFRLAIGREVVPKVQLTVSQALYAEKPVTVQYRHLTYLRRLRECWDALLRQYEKNWTIEASVRCRAVLAQHAAMFLQSVNAVSPEVVEATQQRTLRDLNKAFESLTADYAKTLMPFVPPEDDPHG